MLEVEFYQDGKLIDKESYYGPCHDVLNDLFGEGNWQYVQPEGVWAIYDITNRSDQPITSVHIYHNQFAI